MHLCRFWNQVLSVERSLACHSAVMSLWKTSVLYLRRTSKSYHFVELVFVDQKLLTNSKFPTRSRVLFCDWPVLDGFNGSTIKLHCPFTLSGARLMSISNIKNFLEAISWKCGESNPGHLGEELCYSPQHESTLQNKISENRKLWFAESIESFTLKNNDQFNCWSRCQGNKTKKKKR